MGYYKRADDAKNPLSTFLSLEVLLLSLLGLGIFLLTPIACNFFDIIEINLFLGVFCIISATVLEFYWNRGILKYGIIFVEFGYEDSIRQEPLLLIKLRDPRVKTRKCCLMKILNCWDKIEVNERGRYHWYQKRILYCLVDRNPEVRRLACEILHTKFGKTLMDIKFLLRDCLQSEFYLIDNELRKDILSMGLNSVRICGNAQCFSLEEPCFNATLDPILPSVIMPKREEIVGFCVVCQLPIYLSEEQEKCPWCYSSAHRTHLLEWIKIKGRCPNCYSSLKDIDFAESGLKVRYY